MKELTEKEFAEQYELVTNQIDENASWDGKMFETFGPELEYVRDMAKENRVITIIEADTDDEDEEGNILNTFFLVSGMHFVNRYGYMVTTQPITEEFEVKIED